MFLLKKIISAFFLPVPIGIILLFLALFFLLKNSYKKAKIFLVLGFFWFALLSNQTISNMIISPLENAYPALKETPKDIKYILVLGNGHKTNDNFPITSELNTTAINRLIEGIRHYKNLENSKLIVSGYSFDDVNSHAQMQKKLAISLGVNEADIITLDTPKDTKEEAIEAKKIVGNQKLILVTTASHMKRAVMLFEKEDLNIISSPTNHKFFTSTYPTSYFNATNIKKVELAFHEYLGMVYSYVKGEI
ncbi:ElyC/SanA/YdcF family protein [Aliarcobacter butzleri]|uniref:ElyC/SanA/YdcF family protein n=1 Tax=Aliarcobacter butzleri TaxID=28197 RepID=UPI0021B25CEE|nr:ElyC/SanA/YdcF family protein [Aliarcobacter butzleri]MCT7597139.1 YdcF family protein [Aliarcobacter butzleri]